jgi:hypothetical protein
MGAVFVTVGQRGDCPDAFLCPVQDSRSIALDQLGRLQAGGEPDMLHCPEAYSRYRDLHILPLSRADSTDK